MSQVRQVFRRFIILVSWLSVATMSLAVSCYDMTAPLNRDCQSELRSPTRDFMNVWKATCNLSNHIFRMAALAHTDLNNSAKLHTMRHKRLRWRCRTRFTPVTGRSSREPVVVRPCLSLPVQSVVRRKQLFIVTPVECNRSYVN